MYNRRYDKAFIMLKQEVGGFSLKNQSAWGSCIMELKNKKGRFHISVQSLKKLTDGRKYEVFVIGGKGSDIKGISCGEIQVDQYGKGELKYDFNPDSIGCFCIEQLHTVAVIVKGGYGLTVPLEGYFNEKQSWKKYFKEEVKQTETKLTETKQKPDLRAAEAILSDSPKSMIYQKSEIETKNDVEPVEINAQSKNSDFQKNFKDMIIQFKKELDLLENNGILSKQEKEKISQIKTEKQPQLLAAQQNEKNVIEEQKKEQKQEQKQEQTQEIEQNKEITYILQHNDDIRPFGGEAWKSIALEELIVLPINATEMMKQLFVIASYRKYKHFIFQKTAPKEYIIGMPAQYHPENRAQAEALHFDTFQHCGKELMKTGCYGYWLRKIK